MRSTASPSFTILLLFLILGLSACGSPARLTPGVSTTVPTPAETQPTAEKTSESTSTITPQPSPQDSPTPTPEPTTDLASLPLPQYSLEVDLDYSQHSVSVRENIQYTNRSPDTLQDMVLMVEPAYYSGVFRLGRLAWGDGSEVSGTNWDGTRLKFPLLQPLPPAGEVTLNIEYELFMPTHEVSEEIRPIPFGYTPRQLNLVDWYPFIPPYRSGEGWVAHPQGYFGEHLVLDLADFNVAIRFSDGRTDLTLAASAEEVLDGEWHRYRHERARNFALSASTQYQTAQTTVGNTTITSYYFPYHPTAGKEVLEVTARSVELYNRLFAEYPRTWLAAVEADFLDGMEYDGMYFLSYGFYNSYEGKPGGYLTAIAAHETAHQWFYAMVANDQALEPWLDEALCTYAERLYYENVAPEGLNWWWASRVDFFQPRGWVNTTIYNSGGYRDYRDAVYLNGAYFLEELRLEMGDEAFFAFLQAYLAENAGRIATKADFFDMLSIYSDQDLTPIINAYFYYSE